MCQRLKMLNRYEVYLQVCTTCHDTCRSVGICCWCTPHRITTRLNTLERNVRVLIIDFERETNAVFLF